MLNEQEHEDFESKLLQTGTFTKPQKYRWNRTPISKSMDSPLRPLLQTELELREVVQRELSLKDLMSPSENFNKGKPSQARKEAIQAELQVLNKRYWLLEREWWKHVYECCGLVRRAFDLWRFHSNFGTCIVPLSSAVLQGEGAVVIAVDVVSIATSPKDASLGSGTVQMNVNAVRLAYHSLQTLPRFKRGLHSRILISVCLPPTMTRCVELRFGGCLPLTCCPAKRGGHLS
jgi:hypothetical protein